MAKAQAISLWEPTILRRAIADSLRKLDPRIQLRNPVMFIVELGSVVTTLIFLGELFGRYGNPLFSGQVAAWLWLTVVLANFTEAMAEGRGKAQAETLRKTKTETVAHRVVARDRTEDVPAAGLRKGDEVIVKTGETIPPDGEIVEGIASVDE